MKAMFEDDGIAHNSRSPTARSDPYPTLAPNKFPMPASSKKVAKKKTLVDDRVVASPTGDDEWPSDDEWSECVALDDPYASPEEEPKDPPAAVAVAKPSSAVAKPSSAVHKPQPPKVPPPGVRKIPAKPAPRLVLPPPVPRVVLAPPVPPTPPPPPPPAPTAAASSTPPNRHRHRAQKSQQQGHGHGSTTSANFVASPCKAARMTIGATSAINGADRELKLALTPMAKECQRGCKGSEEADWSCQSGIRQCSMQGSKARFTWIASYD